MPRRGAEEGPRDGPAPLRFPRSLDTRVEFAGVTKRFGERAVVEDVSVSVGRGQVFGLIGPSGCGKTTLVRLLVGLAAPSNGAVRVNGVEPGRFQSRDREQIGYMPQGFLLYPTLTVMENARFVAGLYGLGWWRKRRRVREVLKLLELWEARRRLARNISGGMQRRLALACALFHSPALIVVDEPTAGLDPILRARIWEHLHWLRDSGATVFLTTQYIEEAALCDRVAMLNGGRIVAEGTPDELRRMALGGEAVDVEADRFERSDIVALWNLPEVQSVEWKGGNELRLRVHGDAGLAMAEVTRVLIERGRSVIAVRPYVPTFDEVFVELVASR